LSILCLVCVQFHCFCF